MVQMNFIDYRYYEQQSQSKRKICIKKGDKHVQKEKMYEKYN